MGPEFRFSTTPEACPYLPEEVTQMSYRLIPSIATAEYEGLLDRGWRRFGYQFFRPRCPQCARCRSLRVRVADFRPNKSQRRVLAANRDVHVVVQPASASAEHVLLYNDYHDFMAGEKGWKPNAVTLSEYAERLVGGRYEFAYDFLYYLGEDLIGVGLVDLGGTLASSIYFYHAGAYRSRALGVFSLLTELAHLRAQGLTYHHLGYWVPECGSLRYKSSYQPYELLRGYPGDDQFPEWVEEVAWSPVLNTDELGIVL